MYTVRVCNGEPQTLGGEKHSPPHVLKSGADDEEFRVAEFSCTRAAVNACIQGCEVIFDVQLVASATRLLCDIFHVIAKLQTSRL